MNVIRWYGREWVWFCRDSLDFRTLLTLRATLRRVRFALASLALVVTSSFIVTFIALALGLLP